jgi:anti-anti-sigma factor
MELTKRKIGGILELRITGRLDAYWAEHLGAAVEGAIREGSHQVQLNMAGLDYLSSAGIRVLLKYYKQLKEIKGSLAISDPSENAIAILELAGLTSLLARPPAAGTPGDEPAAPKRHETETTVYQVFLESADASLQGSIAGTPAKIQTAGFTERDCQSLTFPESTFGLGIGAFGTSFADCQERFGEFMALGGVAAYLPTDGTNVPDYSIAEGLLVPQVEALYALTWTGAFSHLIRFEAKPEPPGVTGLSEVVDAALKAVKSDAIGMVIVAESAGLVGATLTQSPTKSPPNGSTLSFPTVRDWVSFTSERAFDRALCVIVGVAAREAGGPFESMLRPLGKGTAAAGHFHAAVFPYRPLQRGRIDLYKTVNGLFGAETLQSLIHLLADDRELEGVGQSELLRGACWAGPLRLAGAEAPASA